MTFAKHIPKHALLTPQLDDVLLRTPDLWEELRGGRIFLTGGTGFIGCWLLETFLHAHDRLDLRARIHVLTRDPGKFTAKAPHLALHPAVTLGQGDVRSFAFPAGTFSHIIHGATDVGVTSTTEQEDTLRQTITAGTQRVLAFAAACGAHKMLLLSSGAVYGPQPTDVSHMPEDETAVATPLLTSSAYAEGKREAECLWRETDSTAIRTIARCFAFVGPYLPLDAHFAIGNFISDAMQGGPIIVQGDGTSRRSYLYAADLAVWLWTILVRGKNGSAYNVGSQEERSIAGVARSVAAAVVPACEVQILEHAKPQQPFRRYVPSTARARDELGLTQTVSLEDAIQRTIAWYADGALSPSSA
jgi:dTDP-glucose 4,6-dehydratase